MSIFKKILIITTLYVTNLKYSFAVWSSYILDNLTNTNEDIIINWVSNVTRGDLNILDKIFNYFQNSISWLIMIIAIWVFLYIWIKIIVAKWNPEEFKKHMLQFVYAAIWLFLVSASWAIVKLVAWLNIK